MVILADRKKNSLLKSVHSSVWKDVEQKDGVFFMFVGALSLLSDHQKHLITKV